MPTLTIPDAYTSGLRKLASLEIGQFESLKAALDDAVPRLKVSDLITEVRSRVKDIDADNVRFIVEALNSLSGTLGAHEQIGSAAFVSDVIEALQKDVPEFGEPAVGWEKFKEELASLLGARALRISSRADDVQHEEPNVFTTARILSDVRMVFDADSVQPNGALIIHNLKITYFADGDYRDLYVSMDNADLKLLRSVIERAEKKTVAMKDVIAAAKLTYFDSE